MNDKVESELRSALSHLHDPDYQPTESLCELLGCEVQDGTLAIQSAIVQAIEGLKPFAGTPASAQTKRAYELLYNRFVLRLTLEETAECLHMSYSSTWRAQRAAVHLLARVLWEQLQERSEVSDEPQMDRGHGARDQSIPAMQAPEWSSQVQRELAALQSNTPGIR